MLLLVLLNTIILAMDGLYSDTEDDFSKFNMAFIVIFTVELGLKCFAIGPIRFARDKMNIFDSIIQILSIVEVVYFEGNSTISAFRSVRIFRTFRVLRVTKLVRSLQYMQVILSVVSESLQDFLYISFLLMLFIYIYALFGMQIFGGKIAFSDVDERINFDNFGNSALLVFQVVLKVKY